VRFDAAAAAMLGFVAVLTAGAAEHANGPWEALALSAVWLLPPVRALGSLVDTGSARTPGMVPALAICLAYGAAYVAGAVAVLRKRSITT
jgi:hypothetical protein